MSNSPNFLFIIDFGMVIILFNLITESIFKPVLIFKFARTIKSVSTLFESKLLEINAIIIC